MGANKSSEQTPNLVCETGTGACLAEGHIHGGWCDDHNVCHCKPNMKEVNKPNLVCETGGTGACLAECIAEGHIHGGWCDDHNVCHCKPNSEFDKIMEKWFSDNNQEWDTFKKKIREQTDDLLKRGILESAEKNIQK